MRRHGRQARRNSSSSGGGHAGHGADLETIERHVGLVCSYFVGCEGEAQLENFSILFLFVSLLACIYTENISW